MKKINELTNEELLKVFDNNKKLREKVENSYIDDEMYWVGERLNYIKKGLSDWSIGFYQTNNIRIENNKLFIEGLKNLQKDMCFLGDEHTALINKTYDNIEELEFLDCDTREYRELDELIDEQVEKLQELVINQFDLETEIKEEYIKNYFADFYVDVRMEEENFYVDKDYILYENTIVCYK